MTTIVNKIEFWVKIIYLKEIPSSKSIPKIISIPTRAYPRHKIVIATYGFEFFFFIMINI